MIIIYIFVINSLVLCAPNQRQRNVIEALKRDETLYDFHPNEKLNNKMKIGPYPQDQIDCQLVSICNNCKTSEAYLITSKNVHLIGLHFGYKQEILDLFNSLKFIDQNSDLLFAFSEKSICIEKYQLSINISLFSIFNQYNISQKINEVFPHLIQIEDNVKLHNIQMRAKFDKNDWIYEIESLNYTGDCISEYFVCEEFYQGLGQINLRVKGKLIQKEEVTFEIIGSENNKKLIIEKIVLPSFIFDQLIKQFFGERFIEQIEYSNMNRSYKIEVNEFLVKHNLKLELMMEEQ